MYNNSYFNNLQNTYNQQQNIGLLQYQNLINNLLRNGLTPEQIVQMSNNQNFMLSNPSVQGFTQNSNVVQPQTQEQGQPTTTVGENELFLSMFNSFCQKNPQDAKELSSSLTKFARWTQSTIDKNVPSE